MSLKSKVYRASFSFLLLASLCATAFGDTIRLKDGSIIKGKIVGFSGGKFTISMGGGTRRRQMTFSSDEIESIDFDTPREMVASVPTSTPASATIIDEEKDGPASVPAVEEKLPQPAPTTNTSSSPANTGRKVSFSKPIELSVKVLADNTANGWTNSGWVVKRGQRIRISGSGEVSIGKGKTTGPSGLYDVEDSQKLLKSVPTGALIAVIGDDNNDFIYIGSEREFVAARDGALFLGLNEGNLNDNTGSFTVKVEISPDGGE
ncbi:MAG TPA: LecA/PA-IL family lectin [Pyrinomonadaceae bacterium]